jgi:hypothetical protein
MLFAEKCLTSRPIKSKKRMYQLSASFCIQSAFFLLRQMKHPMSLVTDRCVRVFYSNRSIHALTLRALPLPRFTS